MCQEAWLGNGFGHRHEWKDLCNGWDSSGRLNSHGGLYITDICCFPGGFYLPK